MQKFTLDEKLELKDEILLINSKAWPEFMLHWDCKEWTHLFSTFSNFQVVLLEDKNIIAFGHTIPLCWEGEIENIPDNMKTLIEIAVETKKKSLNPNILLALAVVISQDYKGRGLSSEVLKVMKDIANKNGINTLVVPVRPTLKSKYPLIPIGNYSKWIREDGFPFDPWLRVHKKLGGEVFKTADVSMIIKGTIKEWETWTKMKIYESGKYIFEGALNPIDMDVGGNIGIYTDPCIWVKYSI